MAVLDEWLTWAFSPAISAILVTLLISLSLPLLIHWYLYNKAVSKEVPSFILAGPSGAGKTSLLTLLAHGSPQPTYASQEPSTALLTLPSSTRSSADKYRSENDTSSRSQPRFHLIDHPGHGKLRHHATTSLLSRTSIRGLIFVIDSAAISSKEGLIEAAEYLHDTLLFLQKRHTSSKTSKGPAGIPVLVAANKQDVFTSLPAGLVKNKLEEEINRIRTTKSRGLLDSGVGMEDDVGGKDDEESEWLGEYGSKEFRFRQMAEHEIDVNVIGGNVKGDEGSRVDEWWAWIGENL